MRVGMPSDERLNIGHSHRDNLLMVMATKLMRMTMMMLILVFIKRTLAVML